MFATSYLVCNNILSKSNSYVNNSTPFETLIYFFSCWRWTLKHFDIYAAIKILAFDWLLSWYPWSQIWIYLWINAGNKQKWLFIVSCLLGFAAENLGTVFDLLSNMATCDKWLSLLVSATIYCPFGSRTCDQDTQFKKKKNNCLSFFTGLHQRNHLLNPRLKPQEAVLYRSLSVWNFFSSF